MLSVEDRKVYKLMSESINLVDGHYKLPLLWRNDDQIRPNYKIMAERRLKGLQKKLERDTELRVKYFEQMELMIEKGFVESASETDCGQRIWYIPHHSVINPRKPDKTRMVFDCAAEFKGTSLNQVLMQGPDLVNNLAAVLVHFRKYPVALVADIEGMFHQVKVKPSDRNSRRFLWWPNGDLTQKQKSFRMTVHLFGAISLPSCASFALQKAASEFGSEFEPYVVSTIEKNFYVDDLLLSVPNAKMGIKIIEDLCSLLSKAGFRLTKWI